MRCHGWDNMAPGKNRWHHDPGTALAGPLPDPLRRFDRGAERAANTEHPTDRKSDPMHRRAGTLSGGATERVATVAIQLPQHGQKAADGPCKVNPFTLVPRRETPSRTTATT